ncbi:MAG: transglutaminase family protein [Calditrichaceae bacterium]
MTDTLQAYLQPTYFIDSDSPEIVEYGLELTKSEKTDLKKAVRLYYAVRDGFRYDPYKIDLDRKAFRASSVLKKGYGFCINKAVLLTAAARSAGIPARLGFADVKNHLTSKKLTELMQTDEFLYHGYSELFLDHKWVKATPAFNLRLCRRFNVKPLEFDGTTDSVFHEYDTNGNRHMEYIREHGSFADLPYDRIYSAYRKHYPLLFSMKSGFVETDFELDAEK